MNRARLIISKNEELLRNAQADSNPALEKFKEARNASTYSFGEIGRLPTNNEQRLKSLFESNIAYPLRKQLAKEPPVSTTQEKFMKQFKSLHQPHTAEHNLNNIGDYYDKINARKPTKSPIETISTAEDKPHNQKFESRLDFDPPLLSELVVDPGLMFVSYTDQFQRDSCARIFDELAPRTRRCFKAERTDQPSSLETLVLDLKNIEFYNYSEAILERSRNLLFQSVIKSFGVMSIDQDIALPDKYEIKERKEFASIEINTEPIVQPKKPLTSEVTVKRGIDLVRLQIEREKARKLKPADYDDVLEGKLLEFFDLILEGEFDYRQLDYANKIKHVLKDIDRFKGKYLEGESKINLLLYFFRESKALKDRKDAQKMFQAPPTNRDPPQRPVPPPIHSGETQRNNKQSRQNLDAKSVTSRKAASDKAPMGSRIQGDDDDANWIGSAVVK